MSTTSDSKTILIRTLNDTFRRTFLGGAVMITAGMEAMPIEQRRSLLQKVRSFEAFGEDNDPHGEHDFVAVDEAGERYFWKLEYYDRTMESGSPDPRRTGCYDAGADHHARRRILRSREARTQGSAGVS
jgi:hypothetical protein